MKYKYWLASMYEISSQKKRMLIEYGISSEELYYMNEKSLEKIDFLTNENVECIRKNRCIFDIDEKWGDFSEKGINFVSLECEAFPYKLKNITDCPYSLFYIGRLPDDSKKNVAIVGARNRSAYGSDVARLIGQRLAENGVGVISGLARGIDSDSHIGCLKGKGQTYAVLASGVDICYPRENKYIYEQIKQKGGIISENLPGTQARSFLFPLRNRIISALSDAVVVIEAKSKSGSLISADYALEQGKDIYAVPGRISDSLSEGCNKLIYQGAQIIYNIDDFLESLDIYTSNSYVQMDFKKNLLEKDELLVYSLLDFRPLGISYLMNQLNIELSLLINVLERLQDKGFINEIIPNYFVKVL